MEFVPVWIFITTVAGVILTGLIALGGLLAYILRSHLNPVRKDIEDLDEEIKSNETEIKGLSTTILGEIQTISKEASAFTLQYTKDIGELRDYIHLNFPGRQELTDKLNSLEKLITDKDVAAHARMKGIEQRFENTKH